MSTVSQILGNYEQYGCRSARTQPEFPASRPGTPITYQLIATLALVPAMKMELITAFELVMIVSDAKQVAKIL